ncbi:hypothetical protein [Bifidobacterium sp.]
MIDTESQERSYVQVDMVRIRATPMQGYGWQGYGWAEGCCV